jgi:hypothetical protein
MSKNSKAMEDKILKIGTHLKEGTITEAEAKRALLVLLGVSNMLTVKEVLDILDDSDHLDDAKTLIRETVS